MTRKHFKAVAETLKHIPDIATRTEVALSMAVMFSTLNPRFSRAKFLTACAIMPVSVITET